MAEAVRCNDVLESLDMNSNEVGERGVLQDGVGETSLSMSMFIGCMLEIWRINTNNTLMFVMYVGPGGVV